MGAGAKYASTATTTTAGSGGGGGFDKINEPETLDGDLGAVVDFYSNGGEETYTGMFFFAQSNQLYLHLFLLLIPPVIHITTY
jgi:hypothetical protein